jgi:hypothetical protein
MTAAASFPHHQEISCSEATHLLMRAALQLPGADRPLQEEGVKEALAGRAH